MQITHTSPACPPSFWQVSNHFILALLFIITQTILAQVVIKDTVEITPKHLLDPNFIVPDPSPEPDPIVHDKFLIISTFNGFPAVDFGLIPGSDETVRLRLHFSFTLGDLDDGSNKGSYFNFYQASAHLGPYYFSQYVESRSSMHIEETIDLTFFEFRYYFSLNNQVANNIQINDAGDSATFYYDYYYERGIYFNGYAILFVIRPDTLFDHFEVNVKKDTIRHGESDFIFITAKDAQNNDADLDGNTFLTFTIDSTQYGSFISATGDTVPSPLENVLYSDAKEGKIRFTVNKTNPVGMEPRKVTIIATKADDVTKEGKDSVFVREFVKIKIALDKTELKPLGNSDKKDNPNYNKNGPDKRKKIIDFLKVNKTTATVTITDRFDKPVKDYRFAIRALVRNQSGGHNHTSNRPTGKLITPEKDTLAMVLGTTDVTGKVTYTYLSSGFGGVDSLYLKGTTDKDTATAIIILKMANFEELKDSTYYDLVGSTTTHVINHYGTSNTIQRLKALADSAHADSSWTLQYNDISLSNGGPFDHRANWDTPHELHREGNHVDMRPTSTDGRRISLRWLEKIFSKNQWGTVVEEDTATSNRHFHIKFQ